MNIQHYLHLYLGCEVMLWTQATNPAFKPEKRRMLADNRSNDPFKISYAQALEVNAKPILRPLSDMTEIEAAKLGMLLFTGIMIGRPYSREGYWHVPYGIGLENFWTIDGKVFNQLQTIYLLSRHFDLFGLIDAGLAINKLW